MMWWHLISGASFQYQMKTTGPPQRLYRHTVTAGHGLRLRPLSTHDARALIVSWRQFHTGYWWLTWYCLMIFILFRTSFFSLRLFRQ
jgi:hypothetical protein